MCVSGTAGRRLLGIFKRLPGGKGAAGADAAGEAAGGKEAAGAAGAAGKTVGAADAAGEAAGTDVKKVSGAAAWLIFGLGNPGAGYADSRHNVGFRTVDEIAARTGIPVKKNKLRSLVGEGVYEGSKIILVKPQTFMNLSGDAVQQAMRYYKAKPQDIIVIYDDVDIAPGSIRIRAFGGPGTHNGMRSITDCIGEGAKFPRVRIGIGKQPPNIELRDYVLKRFSPSEAEPVKKAIAEAAAAALDIVRFGAEQSMNLHNPKKVK